MLFNSWLFILFLVVTCALYYIPLFKKYQVHILIIAGVIFSIKIQSTLRLSVRLSFYEVIILLGVVFLNGIFSFILLNNKMVLSHKRVALLGILANIAILSFMKTAFPNFLIEKEKTFYWFEEYLNFGGYPRVVLEDELKHKRMVIDDIFRSYLERDISSFLRVEKLESFSHMIRLLAGQAGNLLNHNEVSNTLGISLPTLKNYLWYAENTYVLQRVTPFFKNLRKEITKSPVYYFYDSGLRNYALGIFGLLKNPHDFSFIFQGIVYAIMKEKVRFSGAKLHFWRTKDGAEVELIADFGQERVPVEVKFQKMNNPDISRSMRSFIKKYSPKKALVVNLGLEETRQVDSTTVTHLPFSKFMGEHFQGR